MTPRSPHPDAPFRLSFPILKFLLLFLSLVALSACGSAGAESAQAIPSPRPAVTATLVPTFTTIPTSLPTQTAPPTATFTVTPSPTLAPAAPPPPTATPDPFAPYTIESLAARSYGNEGAIEIGALLEERTTFRRYAFTYPSDGLRVTGYLNLPQGEGPFPVILLNHGYYTPSRYRQGDGTRAAADALAEQGYLTLASDYRNHAGSDPGPSPFRTGYVVDVMNLLALLNTLPPGWADPQRVGMWGHSMGGGITVNAAVLAGDALDAVVIYGGMSGDMADNTRHIRAMWERDEFTDPVRAWGGPDQHPDAYARLSALNYLHLAHAAFSIHHGTHDEQVPYPWSEKLGAAVATAGLPVEHFAYPHAPHSFRGDDWAHFMARVTTFFDAHLHP